MVIIIIFNISDVKFAEREPTSQGLCGFSLKIKLSKKLREKYTLSLNRSAYSRSRSFECS
jgi:hypothetical protein